MARNKTNSNRILQAVLADEKLIEFGNFNPSEYEDIDAALDSNIPVVRTVAQIIEGVDEENSEKEIYTTILNYLKSNI